jgi:hypothetical protein
MNDIQLRIKKSSMDPAKDDLLFFIPGFSAIVNILAIDISLQVL